MRRSVGFMLYALLLGACTHDGAQRKPQIICHLELWDSPTGPQARAQAEFRIDTETPAPTMRWQGVKVGASLAVPTPSDPFGEQFYLSITDDATNQSLVSLSFISPKGAVLRNTYVDSFTGRIWLNRSENTSLTVYCQVR